MSGAASVFLVLAMTFCAEGKSPQAKQPGEPQIDPQAMEWHNEKTNQTMLYVALGVVRLEKAELSAMAFRWYRGKGRLGAVYGPALFMLSSNGHPLDPKYRDDHDMVIKANGQAVKIGPVGFESLTDPDRASGFVRVGIADDESFLLLSRAHSIDGMVGPDSFRLSPKQVEGLQDFARHVLDPRLPIKPFPQVARQTKPAPDRSGIPKGQGVLWRGSDSISCTIYRELGAIDELGEMLRKSPREGLAQMTRQAREGISVEVPSRTAVKVLGKIDRRQSPGLLRWLLKVEVLDGPAKGLTGWCAEYQVIVSLKDPSDRDEHMAEFNWERAQRAEKEGGITEALADYRRIINQAPKSTWATRAAERIKALSAK